MAKKTDFEKLTAECRRFIDEQGRAVTASRIAGHQRFGFGAGEINAAFFQAFFEIGREQGRNQERSRARLVQKAKSAAAGK